MLYISASDSYRSRSAELVASLTSYETVSPLQQHLSLQHRTSSRLTEAFNVGLGV